MVRFRKGFTIVELLIVVVVIAILAAITVIAYNGVTSQARDASTKSTVTQLERVLMMNQVERGDMHVIAMAGIDEGISIEDFIEINNLDSLTGSLCVYPGLNENNDEGFYTSNAPCQPAIVEGEIPVYDKSRVYVYDYGYRSASWNEVVFSHTSYISYSRWVEAEGVWTSVTSRFSKATLDHGEDTSDRTEYRYRCSPMMDDHMFTERCVFSDPGSM